MSLGSCTRNIFDYGYEQIISKKVEFNHITCLLYIHSRIYMCDNVCTFDWIVCVVCTVNVDVIYQQSI